VENKQALYELCLKFIEDNNIHCAETVYQADRVIEHAYQFITDICDIIGYVDLEGEEDDE
jgi:hypothetical protein